MRPINRRLAEDNHNSANNVTLGSMSVGTDRDLLCQATDSSPQQTPIVRCGRVNLLRPSNGHPLLQRNAQTLLRSLEIIDDDGIACDSVEQPCPTDSNACSGSFSASKRRDFQLQCQYGCRRCRPNANSACPKRYRCLER